MTAGKIGVFCLLFFAKFEYSIIYLIVCIISWLVIPYPKYNGKNKFKKIKSIEQFEDVLSERCQKKE